MEQVTHGKNAPGSYWIQNSCDSTISLLNVGLMLQATEQGLGLSVVRELFAADALRTGRLAKLSDVSFIHEGASSHKLVCPTGLQDWAPLKALRAWLRSELEASLRELHSGPKS